LLETNSGTRIAQVTSSTAWSLFHDTVELGWTGPNADRALELAANVARVHSHQLLGHAVEFVT
jgi:hypothetical protein